MGKTAKFLVRWIVTAIAVSFAIALVPCIQLPIGDQTMMAIMILSAFLAIINVTIKPILQALSLPLSILTVGIFAVVINTAMLYLAVYCASTLFHLDMSITSFGMAFVASIVISIATWILSNVTSLE